MKTNPDRRRGTWWLVAAVSLSLAAACSGAASTGSASSPTVAPSSTTDAGLIQADFQGAGTHPTVTLEAPAPPWSLYRDDTGRGFAVMNEAGGASRSISFWDVGMVPRNPCHPIGNLVDPGPTVDGLVTALEDQSMRHATAPTDVTIAGYQGKYLEWSVPADLRVTGDSDFSGCDVQSDGHRNFESWEGNGGVGQRWQQMAGQIDQLWILNVNGRRLVVDASHSPNTTQAQINEEDGVVSSIRFAA